MKLAILILAAGYSRRMRGADKLLEPVDGLALLARTVQRAVQTGYRVGVTLADLTNARADQLSGFENIDLINVPDAQLGMSRSIAAGVAAYPTYDAVMIVPADMPGISASDMSDMISFYQRTPRTTILRATSQSGEPGHPVIFPHDLFSDLEKLSGDQGARSVLERHKCRIMSYPLPDNHATVDLDTPEDWDVWRRSN